MLTNLRLAYCGCPHTDIRKYEQPAFNQQVAALRADGLLVLNLTTLCDGHHTLPV